MLSCEPKTLQSNYACLCLNLEHLTLACTASKYADQHDTVPFPDSGKQTLSPDRSQDCQHGFNTNEMLMQ